MTDKSPSMSPLVADLLTGLDRARRSARAARDALREDVPKFQEKMRQRIAGCARLEKEILHLLETASPQTAAAVRDVPVPDDLDATKREVWREFGSYVDFAERQRAYSEGTALGRVGRRGVPGPVNTGPVD
ncbi:hypothetical protein [Komagataeibacter saccharivorans]|uniref:hypothetical protein n=1 Tax=Komagataeibacter saccharivorans TaxID=265959 RepID=UPI0024A8D72A|nr:hypothetical protein [Komagataeibacter saccharivorans]